MQTNRQNGSNVIRIMQGLPLTLPLVRLDAGGTPNHKVEAAVAWLGAYGLLTPDKPKAQQGLDRCLALLKQQETEGHMLIEPLTDSHAPIWLRAMTALRIISGRLRNRGPGYAQLERDVLRWFEGHRSLLMLGRVPRGPLAGQVVLPCARKAPGVPGNRVRDAFLVLSKGLRLGPHSGLGPNSLILSEAGADNAALPLTRIIAGDPNLGFGPSFESGKLPRLMADLRFEAREGGHIASFVGGLPSVNDPAPSCWIDYASGQYSFTGAPAPDLGGQRFVTHVFTP